MFHNCLKLFTRKGSRYISWNILLLWGLGLWIALCTSNMYQSNVLSKEGKCPHVPFVPYFHSDDDIHLAIMIYQQNWNSGTECNITMKGTTVENMSNVTLKNCSLCNIVLVVTAVIQYVYVLLLMCFVIPCICMREKIRKRIKVSDNITHRIANFYPIGAYLKTIANYREETHAPDRKILSPCDLCTLQSKLIANCEISVQQYSEQKLVYKCNEVYFSGENKIQWLFNANISVVQNEIIFSNYTLLLFDNYELYRYFKNEEFQNTCNRLTKYSAMKKSSDVENDLESSNCKKSNCSLRLNKGIISSSPEFQKFLANLNRSRFLYPCILEASASYFIRIKLTYK